MVDVDVDVDDVRCDVDDAWCDVDVDEKPVFVRRFLVLGKGLRWRAWTLAVGGAILGGVQGVCAVLKCFLRFPPGVMSLYALLAARYIHSSQLDTSTSAPNARGLRAIHTYELRVFRVGHGSCGCPKHV